VGCGSIAARTSFLSPSFAHLPIELRRKDDGKPARIEWWSKHAAGGRYLRTMFIDITDRVLMEQEKARLEAQNAYLLDELRTEQNFGDMVRESSGLRKVMQQVQLVAPTDATVLITGKSGTGKELIARAIHERGARTDRSLVKLNCSAVPEGLFESEFFGHVKGAFTGALKDKPGRFELADGGTLFLDEIGEVPLAMQAKLLRVLQEQELERLGDTRTRKVNVRVIAASNRDLKKEVDEGRFREDLFYRLSVFPIEVPPLRERRDDIAPLVAHFVTQSTRRMNRPELQISKSAQTNSRPTTGRATYANFKTSWSAPLSSGGRGRSLSIYPRRGHRKMLLSKQSGKRTSRSRRVTN
jgi:formate hydrogenlyase transcriptional activator